MKVRPKYLLNVFAFDGDSTMSSDRPFAGGLETVSARVVVFCGRVDALIARAADADTAWSPVRRDDAFPDRVVGPVARRDRSVAGFFVRFFNPVYPYGPYGPWAHPHVTLL